MWYRPLIVQRSLAFKFILPWASKIGTPRFQRAVIDRVPWTSLHEFRDVVDVMDSTTREIYQEKKRMLVRASVIICRDFLVSSSVVVKRYLPG
ncbi:hypothetical protein B0H19DRAFT_580104 [Mycena capillaripes]|nr:hypothetical protein B0H19DRAFT_580104 [Mycena capillaripes]